MSNDARTFAQQNAAALVNPMLPCISRVIEKSMQGFLEEACEMKARLDEMEALLSMICARYVEGNVSLTDAEISQIKQAVRSRT